jgi:hypothetical protein
MDETPRRDDQSEGHRRTATEPTNEREPRGDDNGSQRSDGWREGLTERERQERWPIG